MNNMKRAIERIVWLVSILLVLSSVSSIAFAQDFVWAPEYPAGSAIPEISAPDQNGVVRHFDDLKGENGLLLMMSRSFDW